MYKKKYKAIFLDRDGTINKNYGYVSNFNKITFLKKVPEAIRLANKNKYLVIIISNQSGVARGYFKRKDVTLLHDKIYNYLIKKNKAKINKFYFSTYHKKFSNNRNSFMRKPNPGMIFKAVRDFNIDISKSFFVGDSDVDRLCAKNAGVQFIKKKSNLLTCIERGIKSKLNKKI